VDESEIELQEINGILRNKYGRTSFLPMNAGRYTRAADPWTQRSEGNDLVRSFVNQGIAGDGQ